jgi:hypothetical protein
MTNRFEVSHSSYGARASREILQRQIESGTDARNVEKLTR